jgi:universal stress protein E
MQRFKNILVFTDGGPRSKAVLQRAVVLAQINKARLTALSVIESLPKELQQLIAAAHPSDLWELAVKEQKQKLESLVQRICKGDGDVTTKVLEGSPFVEVIREALRQKHDLVMMAAEGKGGIGDILFGSISMHLMRKCPCPVWVMKSGKPKRDAKVLAAVDFAPSDEDHSSLNVKIMELASSLSRLEGSELHVVHAWDPVSRWLWVAGSRLTESEMAQIDRSNAEARLNWFDQLLGKVTLNDLKVQRHMLEGQAGHEIARLARAKGINVIVMGTVCRAGVPGCS